MTDNNGRAFPGKYIDPQGYHGQLQLNCDEICTLYGINAVGGASPLYPALSTCRPLNLIYDGFYPANPNIGCIGRTTVTA